jgi:signal transduction histidine kinase
MIQVVGNTRSFHYARRRSDRVLAGVAGGIADTLGISDAYVRAAFVTLAAVWGLGGLIYLAFWLAAFDRVEDREADEVTSLQALGLGVAFAGTMLLLGAVGWWPNPAVVLVAGTLAFGTAFLTDSSKPGPLSALMDPNAGKPSRTRIIIGVALLIGGLVIFTASVGDVFQSGVVLIAVALTGVGLMVAFGPWVRRLMTDLGEERNERIRQEERAEVAAHLHDSVLQTLALIQRTDDPTRMSILARHQESELRDWLYGNAPLEGVDLVSTALKRAASKVESDFQIPVEVVIVGDHPVDERSKAVVAAASEAMVNAAKHSGAERLSLYMEAGDDRMDVFVTDQGKGFDLDSVPLDRRGLRESIRSRVERVGGTVSVESEPGEGTEIMLGLPL